MANLSDRIKENERQVKALWDKWDCYSKEKITEDMINALWKNEYKNKLWGFFSIAMFVLLLLIGESIWLIRLLIQGG